MYKKVIRGQDIFLFCWTLALTSNLVFESSEIGRMISARWLERGIDICVLILLLFKAVKFDKYSQKRLLITACMILLTGILYYQSSDNLAIPMLFLLTAENVDLEAFFKRDACIRIIIWILLLILSLSHVIPNYQRMINGSHKNAFGWAHPNTCASFLLWAMLEMVYIKWNRIKFKDICIIICGVVFLNYYAEARTYLVAFPIILVWAMVIRHRPPHANKVRECVYACILPICIMISYVLVQLYRNGNSMGIVLNSLLTGRLAFSNQFLNNYGLSLFGQHVFLVGSRAAREQNIESAILDMSYIRMPIKYGVVLFLIYVVLYTYLVVRLVRRQNYKELMLILYMHIIGIASTMPSRLFSNMTLIFLWAVTQKKQRTSNSTDIYITTGLM